jgi:serine/threonine protein kinase
MSEVYKATDTRLDRTVAIKVLPAHVASDPDLKQRFEREAKTLAALSHPHICPIHDVGSQNGIDFLVMEYLPHCWPRPFLPMAGCLFLHRQPWSSR